MILKKKIEKENKENERNFSDYLKLAERKEDTRKTREEQTNQRLTERYDNKKQQADQKRDTIQVRWEQKMVKRIARNNQQQLKRIERLQTRMDTNIKRRREEDKLEIERRKRKKEFNLYQFQTKWNLVEIKILQEEKKSQKFQIGAELKSDVKLLHFQKGDSNLQKIKNQVSRNYEEDDDRILISPEEIAELKRLDEEARNLDQAIEEEEYEQVKSHTLTTRPRILLPEDELTDKDLAHYDEMALKSKGQKLKVMEHTDEKYKGKEPDEEVGFSKLDEAEEDEAELKKEAEELKKMEEEELRRLEEEELKKMEEEEAELQRLEEDEEAELKRLEEEEEELRRLEEDALKSG